MASFHHTIKSGKRGSAAEHSTYIERLGRYAKRGEDLVHSGHGNMPEWAAGNPSLFWKMADTYERRNGAAYREHEIALPNELAGGELITLAERLVRELIGNKPYQYAIHSRDGMLGGLPNPHMHLMYSDRVPDGLDRPPARVFARYNAKCPQAGGWRKDSGGQSPAELREKVLTTRRTIADLQNEALAQHGHPSRVDHRSLRSRGVQRRPERHLGPTRVRTLSGEEKAVYAVHRAGQGNLA